MTEEKRQRIVRGALEVFLRYGYRRVSMEDIARQVGMSRPALYLSFPSKEAIFREVVETGHQENLHAIEAGLGAQGSLAAKLRHVFELWSVQTFDLVMRSPVAEELMNSSYDFSKDVFERGAKRLEEILTDVLRAAVQDPDSLRPSAPVRARIMIAAAHGFKSVARETAEMRAMIADLVDMTVASLPVKGQPTQARAKPRKRKAVQKRKSS